MRAFWIKVALLAAIVTGCILLCTPTHAGELLDRPWTSPDNLTVSAGANYQWWRAADNAPQLNVPKEWTVGLYNAWQLTKHVDAIGTVEYGTDSKLWQFKIGARYVLKGAQ